MQELFETYHRVSKDVDLKKNDKVFLCDFIKNLDEDDLEAAYLLIYYYHIKDGGDAKNAYPFGCKKNRLRGIDFSLSKLPYKLRNILFKFCKAIESKEDDNTISLSPRRKSHFATRREQDETHVEKKMTNMGGKREAPQQKPPVSVASKSHVVVANKHVGVAKKEAVVKKEATKKEAAKKEAVVKKEVAKKEAVVKKEVAKKESAKKEAAKKEAGGRNKK